MMNSIPLIISHLWIPAHIIIIIIITSLSAMRKKFAYNPESDHLHSFAKLGIVRSCVAFSFYSLHCFPSRFVVAVQCSDISIKVYSFIYKVYFIYKVSFIYKVYSFILTLHRVAWSELSWPGAKMKVAATGAYWCLLVPTGAY